MPADPEAPNEDVDRPYLNAGDEGQEDDTKVAAVVEADLYHDEPELSNEDLGHSDRNAGNDNHKNDSKVINVRESDQSHGEPDESTENVDEPDVNAGNEKEKKDTEVNNVKVADQSHEAFAGPPIPMTSYFTVDNKTRQFIHSKLRAYESRRRSAYAAKLESSSLYWRSFRDLLSASVHETGRAERLVLGTARANATYSDALQASYEDTLIDDRGGLVWDPKKRSKLLAVRSQQDYAVAPAVAGKDIAGRTRSLMLTEDRRNNMLSRLIDSQQIVADKFGENSKQLESEIASELKQLRVDLENKVVAIREIGDTIISELEATELEVSQAWGTCILDVLFLHFEWIFAHQLLGFGFRLLLFGSS